MNEKYYYIYNKTKLDCTSPPTWFGWKKIGELFSLELGREITNHQQVILDSIK